MPHASQEICCRKSHRTSAYHSHFLACIRIAFRYEPLFTVKIHVGCKPLEPLYRYRFIYKTAPAFFLTWMRTYPSERCRERYLLLYQLESRLIFSVGYKSDITLTVCLGRTCQHTWRSAVSHMVGKQQFQICFPGFHYSVRIGPYHHARSYLCGT